MSEPVTAQFAVCIEIGEYAASLEAWKIYRVIPDSDAEAHGQVRVVDESGDDYLYPGRYFRPVELPQALQALYPRAAGPTPT